MASFADLVSEDAMPRKYISEISTIDTVLETLNLEASDWKSRVCGASSDCDSFSGTYVQRTRHVLAVDRSGE